MKKYLTFNQNSILAHRIDVLTVSRDRGYEVFHKGGRVKHSFIYTQKGSLLYRFSGNDTLEAAEGDVVFIPQKTENTTRYLQNGTQVRIIQFDLAMGQLPDYLSAPVRLSLPRAGELIDAFFDTPHPHPLRCLSLLYELLYRIERSHSGEPVKFKKLSPALDHLHAHSDANHKIGFYADLCAMSEPGFRRLFHEYTGLSPIEYRNSLRLERARLLLSSGDYNVSEAAETVGFSNLSFFIRLYKKHFSVTPKNGVCAVRGRNS